MKHFYRNLLCIIVIILAIGGIILMCLDFQFGLDGLMSYFSSLVNANVFTQDMTVNGSEYDENISMESFMSFTSDYNGTIYFRSESKGTYHDSKGFFHKPGWDFAPVYPEDTEYSPLTYYAEKIKDSGAKSYHVKMNMMSPFQREFIPDYSTWANEQGFNGSTLTDCYVTEKDKKEHVVEFDFFPVFDSASIENESLNPEKSEEEKKYSEFVHKKYLSVDEEMRKDVTAYMDEHHIDRNSKTFIEDIKDFFQKEFEYGTDFQLDSKKPMMSFLNGKKGICNNFASASQVMYRINGIPARVVNGCVAYSVAGEEIPVIKKQLHAWTEVYIDGSGWKRVDCTAGIRDDVIIEDPKEDDVPDVPDEPDDPDVTPDDFDKLYVGGGRTNQGRDIFTYYTDYQGPMYFRKETLVYDNDTKRFVRPTPYRGKTTFSPLAYYSSILSDSGKYTVTVVSGDDEGRPYVPDYVIANQTDQTKGNDCYFKRSTGSEGKVDFTFSSQESGEKTSTLSNNGMEEEELQYREYVKANYLSIDEEMKNGLLEYMTRVGVNGEGDKLIQQIMTLLSGFEYSYSLNIPKTETQPLVYFLNQKKGVSSDFAAACSMMFRAKGIPARVASGALSYADGFAEEQTVTEDCRHMWTEIYLDDRGWKRIDPIADSWTEENYLSLPVHSKYTKKTAISLSLNQQIQSVYDGTKQIPDVSEYLSLKEVCSTYVDYYGTVLSSVSKDLSPVKATYSSVIDQINAVLETGDHVDFLYDKNTRAGVVYGETPIYAKLRILNQDNQDVTSHYSITFDTLDGIKGYDISKLSSFDPNCLSTFTVERRPITFTSKDIQTTYDTAFENGMKDENYKALLASGDTAYFTYTYGNQISASEYPNVLEFDNSFKVEIRNKDGEDVTRYYDITYQFGKINVIQEENV